MASKGLSPQWLYVDELLWTALTAERMANNSQNDGIKCDTGFQPQWHI